MLNYIFHISDIHIRHGDRKYCRYDEYSSVFDRLFSSIRSQIKDLKLTSEDFVIIVSGDIFHNKNIVGNYGLMLYRKFIEGLVGIGKTIIFHGNHDRNQNEIEQPSLVSSTLPIDNLTILDQTTSFTIDDVGFSYVSIDDTLDFYKTCGRVENLPNFPLLEKDLKHKIALFHGTFAHVKLYNGQEVSQEFKPYPFEWIGGFDYAILGDIHLRQKGLYDKKTLWGYSGSLVQQNYGEDIINHGYMIWDLKAKKIKDVDVYNDRGYINIKEDNDIIMIRKRGKYVPLEEMISNNIDLFPKTVDVKVYSVINFSNLFKMMSSYGITANIVSNKIPTSLAKFQNYTPSSEIEESIVINKNILIEHFQHHLTRDQHSLLSEIIQNNEKLLFDIEKYPIELHDECYKKNKELSVFISHCSKSDDVNNIRTSFRVKYLEWENLYCYENRNYINFEEVECNSFMINGNNGTGKSAIYDIIVLSIWGDVTTCKQSVISNGIIHYRHKKANTVIEIESDGIDYRIHRSFGKQNGKNTLVKSDIKLYRRNGDKYEIYKKDNSCIETIKILFGTLEEFLSSSMITQNVDFDLLRMNYKDCISMIDKATNIDYVHNLYTLFKSSLNKYKDFRKIIESKEQVYARLCNDVKLSKPENAERHLSMLLDRKDKLEYENNSIAVDANDENFIEMIEEDIEEEYCVTDQEYALIQKRFHELEYILRNEKDCKNEYNGPVLIAPHKPCDLSVIKTEEDILSRYNSDEFHMLAKHTDQEVTDMLKQNKKDFNVCMKILDDFEKFKPFIVEKPRNYENNVLNMINKYYNNIDEFLLLCQQINICDNEYTDLQYHSLSDFMMSKERILKLNEEIAKTKIQIEEIENNIEKCYDDRMKLENVDEEEYSDFEEYVHNDDISIEINKNNILLDSYYIKLDEIFGYSQQLNQFKTELKELQNTCEYDPNCKYCCKQPWVLRMNEIQNQIYMLEQKTDDFFDTNEVDYLTLYNRNAGLKYKRYKNFLEQKDYFEKTLKNNQVARSEHVKKISILEEDLYKESKFVETFYNQSNHLLNCYKYCEYTNKYDIWYNQYQEKKKNKNIIEDNIHKLSQYIEYKPRQDKLQELKKLYNLWENDNKKYLSSLFREKEDIEKKKTSYERSKLKTIRLKILRKKEISSELKHIEEDIRKYSEEITRYKTVCSVHENNENNHRLLQKSLNNISNIIDVMEILIEKFKLYRKDIYQNIVLKKLTEKTNAYIEQLCHQDTKKFEMGYVLTEIKDIIHINWLIKTKNDETNQVVSVNQASGFQHFVISLALRMSLFGNRRCSQLFFDEGFTACDKLNLSIVPSFIQSLLKIFNSVIIVSHIDIIKENVDIVASIQYNENTKSSKIEFGERTDL
jgi:DNA repair exonuclease SbcCD ATPase subunit